MSFDVSLKTPACDHCHRGEVSVYDFNLTHNVNAIVDACLEAAGAPKEGKPGLERTGAFTWSWYRLQGLKAKEVAPILTRAALEANDPKREAEFKAMEPGNGWGSLDSVRRVLPEFLAACLENPEAEVDTWG